MKPSNNRHSLTARVVGLGIICTLITTLVIILYGKWVFDKSLETQLDNHLTSYVDLLAGAIIIEEGEITIDSINPLLQHIPRHWQIDTPTKHIAKSARLEHWLPINPQAAFEPKRLEKQKNIIAVQQAFNFADNTVVIITFGIEEKIAEAYTQAIAGDFNRRLYYSLPLVILLLALIGSVQSYWILKPLGRVKQALLDIRSGDKERIDTTLPTEIQQLSDEINYLLQYTDGIVKRHRHFSGNLAHALKTPLTIIKGDTKSALIKSQVETMLDIIDRNLSKAQAAGISHILSAKTPILPVVKRISESFGKLYQKALSIEGDGEAVFRGDEVDLYEVLGNLIENACKYGKSQVSITLSTESIIVEDDGPGIDELHYESAKQRGLRLDESASGSGLGLSIANDIIELYSGSLRLGKSTLGGLQVTVIFSAQALA